MDYSIIRCPNCSLDYDCKIRIPKLLTKCGHTLCQECIFSLRNIFNVLKCPLDFIEYLDISNAECFPSNILILNMIDKTKEISNSSYQLLFNLIT